MGRTTGFTNRVRVILKNEGGPKTPKEIRDLCGDLTPNNIGGTLYQAKDIHYLGPRGENRGVYYLDGQEELAKKQLEKLKLEAEKRKMESREEKRILRKMKYAEYAPTLPHTGVAIPDVFEDTETEYPAREIFEKVGGCYIVVMKELRGLEKSGFLLGCKVKTKKYYRLNPNSPFRKIADGAFDEAERELDELLKRK